MDDTIDAPLSPEGTVVPPEGRQAEIDAKIFRKVLAQIKTLEDRSSPANRRTLLASLPALLLQQSHYTALHWAAYLNDEYFNSIRFTLEHLLLRLTDKAWGPIAQTFRSSAQYASNYRIRDIYMSRRQQEACTLPSSINGHFFANMSTASSVA